MAIPLELRPCGEKAVNHWIQSQGPQQKANSQQIPSGLQKVFLQQQSSPTLEQTHTRNC